MAFSFLKALGSAAALASLNACTFLFLQPDRTLYPMAAQGGRAPQAIAFKSLDGVKLTAWIFRASGPAKALVVQFHGNAQNMTSHFQLLAWLTDQGFDLLIFDYRGYGQSEGQATVHGAYLDSRAALGLAQKMARDRGLPLVVYGQSLGGSLLLKALEDEAPIPELRLIAVESSFNGYREIAREKLALFWLTWPLQWLAYPLISDSESPGGPGLRRLPHVPIILIYSARDPVVPLHHGVELFSEMNEPKEFWEHPEPGHVNGMFVQGGALRARFLAALNRALTPR